MRACFVHQFSMMLLHGLVDFTKKVEMLLWRYKQKNHCGSAIFQFPPFWRIGIRFHELIGKQKPRTSIAIVQNIFLNKSSVAEAVIPAIVTVRNYLCIWQAIENMIEKTLYWTGNYRSAKKSWILHFETNHLFLSQFPQLVIFLVFWFFHFLCKSVISRLFSAR